MAERSIIVKGTSMQDALSKGLFLLNAERNEVSYEVLQEGSLGRGSLVGTPYKVRVTVGGPPPKGEEEPLPLPDFASTIAEIRPEDLQSLSTSEFLALLERVEASVVPVYAAEIRAEEPAGPAAIDGEVFVEVAPNRMEAFVTVTPAHGGGRDVTTADVHAGLAAAGVRYGIDETAVAEAVARRATRLPIARGLLPQAGGSAQVRYVTPEGALADEMPVGREVCPGAVVAVKIPPAEGAPGTTVLGEALPPHLGHDISLHARKGKNLHVSPDGRELVATASGIVSLVEGKVHVENTLLLERDITAASGHIHFVGDIVIRGSVLRGVSVTAGGHVTIEGNVDVAVVQAGGNVTIGGGILGRGVGTIRAKGSVTCKFIQDAKVWAGGDVLVEDYVRGGEVQAERRVAVGGSVVGGQVYGIAGVRVRAAGSEHRTPTALAAGGAIRAREEIERIRLHVQNQGERLEAVEKILADLLAVERRGEALSAQQRLVAVKAVEERARLHSEIGHLADRKSALLADLDETRAAVVSITQKAFARTRILIDDAALELTADTQYANFTKDPNTSSIRMTALT